MSALKESALAAVFMAATMPQPVGAREPVTFSLPSSPTHVAQATAPYGEAQGKVDETLGKLQGKQKDAVEIGYDYVVGSLQDQGVTPENCAGALKTLDDMKEMAGGSSPAEQAARRQINGICGGNGP